MGRPVGKFKALMVTLVGWSGLPRSTQPGAATLVCSVLEARDCGRSLANVEIKFSRCNYLEINFQKWPASNYTDLRSKAPPAEVAKPGTGPRDPHIQEDTCRRKTLLMAVVTATAALAAPLASAQKIGVTMSQFDDNFLTILRNSIPHSSQEGAG